MLFQSLKESQLYTFDDLREILNIEEDKLKETINKLIDLNIIKRLKYLSTAELEDLLQIDVDNEDDYEVLKQQKESSYLFKYVGMILVDNTCLMIYPKYVNNLEDPKHSKLKQILSVIDKYKKSRKQDHEFGGQDNTDNFNLLSITLSLIYDYYEYGLYSNENHIIEYNGEGTILWEKTINEGTAYFTNGTPVYLDTFTINQESNEQDYFRRLHACIITEACSKLAEILTVLDLECLNISNEVIDNFGSKEYIVQRLNQELTQQFITQRQDILKLLKRYIEQDHNTESDNISFLGSNSFNLVWEDVCSVVMGNNLRDSLKTLNLKYKNNEQATLLAEIIPKPIWECHTTNKKHPANQTLKPDIVAIKKDEYGKPSIHIYDAKYYLIEFNENGIKKQPGVGDLIKQYIYELSYRDLIQENKLKVETNAFLIPTDGKEEIKLGTASLDIFSNLDGVQCKKIEVILKPCESMFRRYLQSY